MTIDVSQTVTDRIITELERGEIPWRKPWDPAVGVPRSIDGRPYRGINALLLGISGYDDPRWGTYRAIESHGGQVRKGERSTLVVLWKPVNARPKSPDDEARSYLLLRYFRVFNVTQADFREPLEPVGESHSLLAADSVYDGYPNRPTLGFGGSSAYYSPRNDHVQIPIRESFSSTARFYTTLFHELTHSTGAACRLNREDLVKQSGFGSEPYSREELTAELGSCMLAARVGIDPEWDQSAAYIRSWLAALQNDKRLIISAAARAQKAVDWILP